MPNVIKTLDDLIESTDTYDIRNTTYYRLIENLLVPATNSYDLYYTGYEQSIGTYSTNYAQRQKYSYNPFILSVDLYGTPSAAWLIMKLNNCECPSKFKVRRYLHLLSASDLQEVAVSIISKSTDRLEANWDEYLNDLDFVYPYSQRSTASDYI